MMDRIFRCKQRARMLTRHLLVLSLLMGLAWWLPVWGTSGFGVQACAAQEVQEEQVAEPVPGTAGETSAAPAIGEGGDQVDLTGKVAAEVAEKVAADIKPSEVRLVGARVIKDLTYATVDGQPLLCDVYLPLNGEGDAATEQVTEKLRPAVIVIHGGGWAVGDKWSVSNYARSFAANGLVAISINYRHAPRYKFPAQVDDVRTALAWVHDQADQYQIDTQRIGMFGYSAGGHLSCMIGTLVDAPWETVQLTTEWTKDDPRWAKLPKLCGIVGGGAPCDFRDLPIDNTAISYFLGGSRRELPEIYKAASPAEHASPGDVPTLFIHGTQDLIVPIASSRILFEAQRSAGVASKFLPLEGPGHMLTFMKQDSVNAAVNFLLATLVGEAEAEEK